MKNHRLLLVTLAMVVVAGTSRSQSIAIDSVSALRFCAGDPIGVSFTATGTWEHNNAFTLQLSDSSGSFSSHFSNLGSKVDSISGTYFITSSIPTAAPFSSHYRLRVIAAYPYTEGSDNGSDLLIGESPFHFRLQKSGTPAVGASLLATFLIQGSPGNAYFRDTMHVNYGEDATPATASRLFAGNPMFWKTSYLSGGWKTIVATIIGPGGCSASQSDSVFIFDCTEPTIPNDAIVINRDSGINADTSIIMDTTIRSDTISANVIVFDTIISRDTTIRDIGIIQGINGRTVWVNPGVSFCGGESDTIFAEAGARISGGNNNIVYLRKGASYTGTCSGSCAVIVVYETGASVSGPTPSLECSGLTFNYSNAPPNAVMHINADVSTADAHAPIELSPNPASSLVNVQNTPANLIRIEVLDLLGQTVMRPSVSNTPNFSLNMSKLAPGVYYVRFLMPNAVESKRIVKQ